MYNAVAGVDVHQQKLTITTLVGNNSKKITKTTWECGTYTDDLVEAGKKIKSLGVTEVAMESTGVYWRPVYNIWSKMGIDNLQRTSIFYDFHPRFIFSLKLPIKNLGPAHKII